MLKITPIFFLLLALAFNSCTNKQEKTYDFVVNTDIQNFWTAFDQIRTTPDSLEKIQLIQKEYIDKGSPGLKAFMQQKNYTPESYINAIDNYPRFWASVRKNTLTSQKYRDEIAKEVEKLKALYPSLKPAKIYFTIGALFSNGTTMDSMVLIGAELAMADSAAVTEELPDRLGENLSAFFSNNPIQDIVLLNLHEYVHTQQNTYGYDLLSQCLYEGVAEFVSVKAAEQPSAAPAILFGKANENDIKKRFTQELFSPNWDDWLYNNFENTFKMRDLGYFIGYAICEKHYESMPDQQQAVKEMIELDFGNPQSVEAFVEKVGYFDQPLDSLKIAYEQSRPEVVAIYPFENNSKDVDPGITEIRIEFSRKMDGRFGYFDFGPLGKEHALPITGFGGQSEDGKSFIYKVELEPNRRYQRELTSVFRSESGAALRPFLIDFTTKQ